MEPRPACCAQITKALPADVVQSGWLGYPAAPEEQILQLENRLGVSLPPSYRAFFKETNGWRVTGFFGGKLWSTDEVEWFCTRHQDLIDAWLLGARSQGGPVPLPDDKYFVFGDEQTSQDFRPEYLQTALNLSEMVDTDVYLLNPQSVTYEGECEAWFFAPWLPGVRRYPSFRDLMQAEYEGFVRMKDSRKG